MSQTNGHYLSVMEIACLPENDPLRVQLREKAQAAGGSEQVQLQQELALTDRLHAALVQVNPRGGEEALVHRLIAVPEAQEAKAFAPPRHQIWRVAAAVVLALGLLGAATYYFWPQTPQMPVAVQLDPAVGKAIADAAVKNHESSRPLEIASADPDAVAKAFSAHGMDFPVLMLKTNNTITLQGGGTCEIAGAQAVYTRWSGNGMHYTLYEFNAPDAGAPNDFVANTQRPRDLWHDDKEYRVMLWPGSGGKCCWALVLEKSDAANPFKLFDYATPS